MVPERRRSTFSTREAPTASVEPCLNTIWIARIKYLLDVDIIALEAILCCYIISHSSQMGHIQLSSDKLFGESIRVVVSTSAPRPGIS